jgi:hypothetical protein
VVTTTDVDTSAAIKLLVEQSHAAAAARVRVIAPV